MTSSTSQDTTTLRQKLALRGIDGVTLLVLPSVLFVLAIASLVRRVAQHGHEPAT